MAALSFQQYILILPSDFAGGQIQYIFTRNSYDPKPLIGTADSIYIDPWLPIVKDSAPHIKDFEEQDALITSDMSYVIVNDCDGFQGTSNGSPVAWQDLFADNTTLWRHILDGADSVNLTKRMLLPDDTWEWYFSGEIDRDKIDWKHYEILDERTSSEWMLSEIRLPVLSGLDRFKNTKVRDLLPFITTANLKGWDDAGTKRPYAKYGGLQLINLAFSGLQNTIPALPDVERTSDIDSNWNTAVSTDDFALVNWYEIVSVNAGTDTFTLSSSVLSLSNGAIVQLRSAESGSPPGGVSTFTSYFIVNSSANTFKLSLTSGGAAIDITSTFTGKLYIAITTGVGSYDHSNLFNRFDYTGKLSLLDTFPHGMWDITFDSLVAAICSLTGINFSYTTPSADEHSLAFAPAVWDGTNKVYTHTFDSPVTLISAQVISFNTAFGISPNYDNDISSVDATANEIAITNWSNTLGANTPDPFGDGDIVHFFTGDSGTLPGGLTAYTDYYVLNSTRTSATLFTFQVTDSVGGSAIDLTSTGSGNIYVSNKRIVKNDISYGLDDPLSEVLKDTVLQNHFVLEFDVVQTGADEGKSVLILSRRRKTEGTVADYLELIGDTAHEQPVDNEQRAVKVGYIAGKDSVLCPVRNEKKIYDVKLRWRNHPWSDDQGIIHHRHMMYDDSRKLWEQRPTWWQKGEGANSLAQFNFHPDGWLGGAHVFNEKTTSTNDRYDTAWDNDALDLASNTNYRGLYVNSKVRYREQDVWFDSLQELSAIILANELLLDPVRLEREYGINPTRKADVRFRDFKCRKTATVKSGTVRVSRVEFSDLDGTVKFQFKTAPDMATLDMTLPLFKGSGSSGSSGGQGGSTGGGGGAASTELAVLILPSTNNRNDITPLTGVTDALMLANNADGDRTMLGFRDTGNIYTHKFRAPAAFAGNLIYELPSANPTANQVLSASAPSSGVVTLSWVAAADLSTAVILSPASAHRNRILPTADSVVALELKKRGSSSSDLLTIWDETDTSRVSVDQNFNLTVNAANISITGAGNITTANGYAHLLQGSIGSHVLRLESDATNDNPRENYWHGRTTTTDGTTWVTAATFQTATNTGFNLFLNILGVRTGGTGGSAQDTFSYGATYMGRNVSGTVTVFGGTTLWTLRHVIATSFRTNVSGTTVQIQVQGATNNNITWHVHIRDIGLGS